MTTPATHHRLLSFGSVLSLVLSALLVCGCSSGEEIDMEGRAPILLSEVDGSTFADDGEPVILRIAAGETIPVNLDVNFGFAQLQPGGNQMQFNREVLLYITDDGDLYLSPNGQRWAAVYDLAAIQDVFEYDGGSASLGLSMSEEAGTQINIGISMIESD